MLVKYGVYNAATSKKAILGIKKHEYRPLHSH